MSAGHGREASFKTHVYITGDSDEMIPDLVRQRMVSLAIVQALDGEELEDAYEYLLDSFVWWAKPKLEMIEDRTRVISSPVIRNVNADSGEVHEA